MGSIPGSLLTLAVIRTQNLLKKASIFVVLERDYLNKSAFPGWKDATGGKRMACD